MGETHIDGTPIDDIITIDNHDAWRRVGEGEIALRRYTVYVRFPEGEIEEIDVDARDDSDARVIADLVVMRDYIDGGVIAHVEERFGLYL